MLKIYKLGKIGNLRSTSLFHAFARLDLFGLILVEPEDTYISLGYFDKAEEILDIQRVKSLQIPIIRREIGGGTVLLAPGQVFYQLVIPKSLSPFKVEDAYRKFSQPVLEVYRRLGVDVEYRPINDIVVKRTQRKISGQGSGDIQRSFVFVGNILLRFDTELMAQILNVPDKGFVKEVLEQNLSWIERETGRMPSFWEVAELFEEEFKKVLPFEGEGEVPPEALKLADQLKESLTSEDCILEDTGRRHRLIKIREGIFLRNKAVEIDGQKLSISMIVQDQIVRFCKLEGLESKVLEREIIGLKYEEESIRNFLEKLSMAWLLPLFWD